MTAVAATRALNRWLQGLLLVVFLFSGAAVFDPSLAGEGLFPLIMTLVVTGAFVIGVGRRVLWAYVGLPLWMFLMAVGELRGISTDPFFSTEGAYVFLAFALLFYAAIALLALRIRVAVFPYTTWRGIKRDTDGVVVVPEQLRP